MAGVHEDVQPPRQIRFGSEGQEPIRADRLPMALIGPRHDHEAIAHQSLAGRGEAVRQWLLSLPISLDVLLATRPD